MTKTQELHVDHLVLLIGTNPLPNYVAVKLLAKNNTLLHLVYTDGTHKIAENLKKVLIKEGKSEVNIKLWLLEDGRDPSEICRCANSIINTIIRGTIGLNYTGGTKPMAVHMHRVFSACKRDVIFTYLDGDNLFIRVDAKDGNPSKAIAIDDTVQLTIEKMLEMHGRKQKSISHKNITQNMQATAKKLLQLYCEGDESLRKKWRNKCNTTLQGSKDELKAAKFPNESPFIELLSNFNGIEMTEMKPLGQMAQDQKWNIQDFAEWLDGKWLEHIVFQILQSLTPVCSINEVIHSLSDTTRAIDFEFDVAALRGHQLFALSITTGTDRKKCKLKLFEAYVRARQLGGDEARTALVCAFDDAKSLEQEINSDWETYGRVRVFGRHDLLDLAEPLKQWLNRNT